LAHTCGALGVDFSNYKPTQIISDIKTEGVRGILKIFTESVPENSVTNSKNWTMEDVARTASLGSFMPVVVGTPDKIADWIEDWKGLGADGFNIAELEHSGTVRDFVEMVVPELQNRGLFRKEYEYSNLRSRLYQRNQPHLPQDHPARHLKSAEAPHAV